MRPLHETQPGRYVPVGPLIQLMGEHPGAARMRRCLPDLWRSYARARDSGKPSVSIGLVDRLLIALDAPEAWHTHWPVEA